MTRNQMTLSMQQDATFERHRKTTRRDVFLAEMDQVVPWSDLCACIEPFYPKVRERGGRPPVGVERMLRIHFLQQWYALSDPAVEEALYDSQAMRRFVGIDLGCEGAPDETTVCKFRHVPTTAKLLSIVLGSTALIIGALFAVVTFLAKPWVEQIVKQMSGQSAG